MYEGQFKGQIGRNKDQKEPNWYVILVMSLARLLSSYIQSGRVILEVEGQLLHSVHEASTVLQSKVEEKRK